MTASRPHRPAIAAIVLAAHLLVVWLGILMARHPGRLDPEARAEPIFTRFLEQPRLEPVGSTVPVQISLIAVARPNLPTPEVLEDEIETLDSPTQDADPAPSSAPLVAHTSAAAQGLPASMGNQHWKLVRKVQPSYPTVSARRGETGVVRMRARVDGAGRVTEVQVLHSSGFDRLDAAATRAIGKWRFEPPVQAGNPVSAWVLINHSYSIYQQKYCRIRDDPGDGSTGEDVHDGAGVEVPKGSEAVLRNLINELTFTKPDAPKPLAALLREWGPVLTIRNASDGRLQGWLSHEILPAYRQGHPGGTVQVRWERYQVQHARQFSNWVVAIDPKGEIWCVHVGSTADP